MSVCSSGMCPAKVAMEAIHKGGYCEGQRTVSIRRAAQITGGGASDNSDTYMASQSAFRAAIAKMEVARDQMKNRTYAGDLLHLSGQSRILGVCYLLAMRESLLTAALNDIMADDPFTIDMCGVYPAALHQAVNKICAEKRVSPFHPPPVDISAVVTGNFARADGSWESLHAIADDLLELSKICSDIEVYHLQAVQKITELIGCVKH